MESEKKWAMAVFAGSLLFKAAFLILIAGSAVVSDDSYHHLTIAQSIFDGRGFVVDVIWPLNLRSEGFPMGYFFRQPVYPLLVASSYHVFGAGIWSARIADALCEGIIAAATFLIAIRLTKSLNVGLLSAALYVVGFYPLYLSPQAMTESCFTMFVVLGVLVILGGDSMFRRAVLGVIVGLSYLTREQGILLLPAFLCYYTYHYGAKKGLKASATVFLAALLVASPWLVRTYALTGNPTFNFASYGALIYRDDERFFAGYERPPSLTNLYLERLKPGTFIDLMGGLPALILGHLLLLPSVFLLLVLFLERKALRSHLSENSGFYAMLSVYYVILLVAVSMFYVLVRYLYSVIPFLAIVSAVCLDGFFRNRLSLFRGRRDTLFHAAILLLILYFNVTIVAESIAATPMVSDISAAFSLRGVAGENDVVMADYPYFVPVILGAKAVQIPSEERYIMPLVRQYNVTYLVHGVARRWYNISDESHLELIHRGQNWTTYRVLR